MTELARQVQAERIAERLIKPSQRSVDLSLPMNNLGADRLFTLLTDREIDIDQGVAELRVMVAQAVLELNKGEIE